MTTSTTTIASTATMGPRIRIALAGACGYGAKYLRVLLDASVTPEPGIDLVAIADPNAGASPWLGDVNARGIPVYADLVQLLSRHAIDLVMLATPIHLHASQTLLALDHDCNVLCEKPLAATLEQALEVVAAARRAKRFVAVGFQWSFSQAVQLLKQDILAGVLGEPVRLRTIALFPRSRQYFRRNAWAGRLATECGQSVFDSPLNNATAHYLHNMLYLLGPTRETSATPRSVEAELYRANDIESFDTAALRCEMPGDAVVHFYTTHASPNRIGPVCHFEFSRATVEFDFADSPQFIARFHDGTVKDYGRPDEDRFQAIWQAIAAARSATPLACGAAGALPHARCVAAARQSCPVTVDFPKSIQRCSEVAHEQMECIDGLEEALLSCYGSGALPSELGLAWARGGKRIVVDAATNPGATLAPSR